MRKEFCRSQRCKVRVDFQKQDGVEAEEVKGRTMTRWTNGPIGSKSRCWVAKQCSSNRTHRQVNWMYLKCLGQSGVLCFLATVLFTVVIMGPRWESCTSGWCPHPGSPDELNAPMCLYSSNLLWYVCRVVSFLLLGITYFSVWALWVLLDKWSVHLPITFYPPNKSRMPPLK